MPFSSCSPASSNEPDPATRSFTVCDTITSDGCAAAPTRAPMLTRCRPLPVDRLHLARVDPDADLDPEGNHRWTHAWPQRTARAGPSNVAKKPSPAVDLSASVARQLGTDRPVMSFDELSPGAVPQL